jgi:hypothetical protein
LALAHKVAGIARLRAIRHAGVADGTEERAMADPDEWDQESDQLDAEDTLDTRNVPDPLDEGISPPERPWIGDGWGVTAREQAEGDSVDRYLARELPDVSPADGDGIGDTTDTDGEPWDDQVGEARSGRLVDADDGGVVDDDEDLWAQDVGIDGAGASAEEAAIHVVGDQPPGDDE